MRCTLLLLLAGAMFPAAVLAQTPPIPAAPAAPATSADDQKLICVDQDPGPASRLQPKRVCHTRAEWTKLGGVPK